MGEKNILNGEKSNAATGLVRRRFLMAAGLAATLVAAGCAGGQFGSSGSLSAGLSDFGDSVPVEQGAPARVALLAPIGEGRSKINLIGRSIANGAQLAHHDLEQNESAKGSIELKLYDTGGTAQGAAAAAQAAISDGASVILGPLLSRSVSAVGPIAQKAGLPVIAFSTDSAVAGRNVFLIGFLPEAEMDRMASYAASQGMYAFGAMAPSTLEGQVVLTAFERAIERNQGEITLTERYKQTFTEIEGAAKRYAEAHNALKESRPIQAILLADGGQSLSSAASYLPYYEIDPRETRLIGIGKWNDASTLAEPSLRGGWFAGPDPRPRAKFAKHYEGAFAQKPHALASLGYDAMAAIGAMVENARVTGQKHPFLPGAILSPSGFKGVNGPFRFLPNGLNERGLAVLEVREKRFKVIDRAPESFTGG